MNSSLSLLASLTAGFALASQASAQISFTGTNYSPGLQPDGVALGDFDGDGDRDMAVTVDAPDRIAIFTNAGDGTFSGPAQVLLGNGSGPAGIVARDMDGDGDVDLVVALKNVSAVQVVTNLGGGAFSPGATTATGSDEPRRVAAGDLDGDGDMDIVVSSRKSNDITALRNTGGALSLVGSFAAGQEPRYVQLADVTGDGNLDAIVGAHDSREVRILNGTGAGGFAGGTVLSTGAQLRPVGVAAADLDGDGDLDVAAATSGNGLNFVSVFANLGGGFGGRVDYASGGVNPDDLAAADFDLDGDLDLATTNQDSGNLGALANSGAGTFGAPGTFATGTTTADLEVADLDGNGSPDVAVVNEDANTVTVLLNDASGGGFGTSYCDSNPNSSGQTAVLTASGSRVIAANDLDLAVAQLPANRFGYMLMSQTQAFVPLFGGSEGNLCLGGQIIRFDKAVQNSRGAGQVSFSPDLTNLPQGTVFLPGDVWNFQYWTRDVNGGKQTSNTSNGLAIQFL